MNGNSPAWTPRVVLKSEEEHLVYAEVYSPLHVDTDGEAMTAEEIRKAAYRFLSEGRVRKIDVQHNQKESGSVVVESFIARKNDPDNFIEGSWVLGVCIPDDELWERVKKGELNGFSFFGGVQKVPTKANVVVTRKMVGETEDSTDGVLPPHSHGISLSFNSDGRIIAGKTNSILEHSHDVHRATATEIEMEHAHRIILIEN